MSSEPQDYINRHVLSKCCDAPMIQGCMCSECGEHAEAQPDPEDIMPVLDAYPKKACTLNNCPPGLFYCRGTLGFKTEYRDVNGPEAYVVASGEYFWAGTSDRKTRMELVVIPAELVDPSATSHPRGEETERKMP